MGQHFIKEKQDAQIQSSYFLSFFCDFSVAGMYDTGLPSVVFLKTLSS